ncbi:MAG: Crp/Fnr family transcriptional regulator [Deltaproteobacteria bacterium]|nr:Crp/Fnr family transcriptional regulator [Deltaproteobacteria bacterium]
MLADMGVYALLRQSDLFESFSDQDLKRHAAACQERIAEAGQVVARVGLPLESVLYLAEGMLVVYRRNKASGVTLLLGLLEAPSIFGDAEWAANVDSAVRTPLAFDHQKGTG